MQYYPQSEAFIKVRGGLPNTSYRITHDKACTVAFMGGSVTDGMGASVIRGGWRTRVFTHLQETYPAATFEQIAANIGGNGSQYGVYFARQFVAVKHPDLVFIEYAVNNAYDGCGDADTLWMHYETLIHTIRAENPYAEIVLAYVSDSHHRSKDIIPVLEQIADKYGLPSLNYYEAVMHAMGGASNWNNFYIDGVHANDNGYDVMASVANGLVEYAMQTPAKTYQKAVTPPPQARLQSEAKALITSTLDPVPSGWEKVEKFSYAGRHYNGCIQTTAADKPITVTFKGTDFGVLVEFAKDAGVLEYSVDGGAPEVLDCQLNYSNPKARMLLKNGTDGEHTVTVRLSSGDRMAIAAFLLNGTVSSVE